MLMTMATINHSMNHGMVTFCPLVLKMNDVTMANGMIHRARVSLMVVAMLSASSP